MFKYLYTRTLLILFLIALLCSILSLPVLAKLAGGPCNAGPVFIGFGFFMIICSILTVFSIRSLYRSYLNKKTYRNSIFLALIPFIIWTSVTIPFFWDDRNATNEVLCLAPFFIAELIILLAAIRKQIKFSKA
jgi:hypothetical protein